MPAVFRPRTARWSACYHCDTKKGAIREETVATTTSSRRLLDHHNKLINFHSRHLPAQQSVHVSRLKISAIPICTRSSELVLELVNLRCPCIIITASTFQVSMDTGLTYVVLFKLTHFATDRKTLLRVLRTSVAVTGTPSLNRSQDVKITQCFLDVLTTDANSKTHAAYFQKIIQIHFVGCKVLTPLHMDNSKSCFII